MRPPVDYTPTGSRLLDAVLNVVDGIQVAILLVLFITIGKRPTRAG